MSIRQAYCMCSRLLGLGAGRLNSVFVFWQHLVEVREWGFLAAVP